MVKDTIQKGNSVTIESYTYDYAGNRTSKTVNENDTTYYVTDTSGDLSQVVAETDEAGKESSYYTRSDELVSMEIRNEVWYYLTDGHGSVRILTNEAGRITDRYSYDAYGSLLEKEGDTQNEFLYTGEQYNANTGLYYLRARYMNPATGTFISMDSYQGSIYDPVTLHKYLYAGANPVTYVDPSGYSFNRQEMDVAMAGEGILTVGQVCNESIMFRIGMNAISRLWSIKAVQTVSYLSTTVLLSLVIDDVLNQRYSTNAYDVAVEILEYALDNIEVICNEAGIASETISAQIKAAIYEAKNRDKSTDKGQKGRSQAGEQEYKTKKKAKKGKEKDDIPDRFKGEKPYKGESGKEAAKRIMQKFGEYDPKKTGAGSDFSKLKKYFDTYFYD